MDSAQRVLHPVTTAAGCCRNARTRSGRTKRAAAIYLRDACRGLSASLPPRLALDCRVLPLSDSQSHSLQSGLFCTRRRDCPSPGDACCLLACCCCRPVPSGGQAPLSTTPRCACSMDAAHLPRAALIPMPIPNPNPPSPISMPNQQSVPNVTRAFLFSLSLFSR
ncbi:hypothetical protein HDK77DRAFT_146378 [Phyllosticta capitalensis]